jgi:high-affinity nickel-transport protein
MITRIFGERTRDLRTAVVGIYVILTAATLAAWAWAFASFHAHPVLLGTALLAYGFGLRHAVDADHIAAIDNVTRKLMQEGQRPVAVGLFFSLGHSTVVVLLSALVALTANALQTRFETFKEVGGVIGTSVSAFFLLLVAIMNLCILIGTHRVFRQVRAGEPYREEDLDMLLAKGGLLARLLRPLFRLIRRSWHMYPLGFLFGLGFDTATEVALLGISATEASKGLPISSVLIFPAPWRWWIRPTAS